MLKSILVGLDGSDDSRAAVELGLRWAGRFDANLTGLAVVDEPGMLTSGTVLFGGSHHWHTTALSPMAYGVRRSVERNVEEFARRCIEHGVKYETLEDVGTPFVQILLEAQCYDLVLLGRHTHFNYGSADEPDDTLGKVLRDSPRPLVSVPERLAGGDPIVVAYDGSLQAARALYAFEASGLGTHRKVHVVSVGSELKDIARHADRAVRFLCLHGIEATPHPVDTALNAAEAILGRVRYLDAGLLVMGAYGQPVLREFFVGSTTRTVLEQCPVPVFCYH